MFLVLAVGAGAASAQPQAGPVADRPSAQALPAELELYLEVTLNGVASGQLSRFVQQGEALYASAATLRGLGLKWPGSEQASGLLPLAGLAGLRVVYDAHLQRLTLSAALDMLDRPVALLGAASEPRAVADPAAVIPGLVFNYDVYAQQTGNIRTLSGFTETRLFGLGQGVWSNTLVSRVATRQQGVPAHDNVRLDTSWQRDFPDQMLSLAVGDVVTGSLPWSRAARIGGIRLSRNFSLQPYRVTTPLASFEGSAVLPSTVDLFVNGLKQSSQQVQPGQFQLSGIPSLGGTGQAQMVITDITGQRRVVSFDLYGAPQLLEPGLSDWSLDLGHLREDYGIRSFSYGTAIASASARHGLSADTTIEGHAEAGRGIVQAGAGGVWRLGGQGGVASASLALSHGGAQDTGAAITALNPAAGDNSGGQWALGYQWNSRRWTVSLNTLRRGAGFRDVASLPGELPARGNDSIYLGLSGAWGQVGLSLIRQHQASLAPSRYANLSWSRQLPDSNASISISLNRNLDNPAESVWYLAWSMPLERKLTVSTSLRSSGASQSLVADAAQSPAGGDAGGIGWRVQAGAGDSSSAQAQLTQLGRYGQLMAGISQSGGQAGAPSSRSVYASASGGVVLAQGQAHLSRRVDDAFALVSAGGVAGIPVQLENRVVGETDARGMLFVTQLSSHQNNRLAIDTLGLPADMRIERATLNVVPSTRSGVLASFPMRRVLALELALSDARGQWLPAGSRLWLDAPGAAAAPTALTVVGFDGLVYLEDPPPGASLRVELEGGSCSAVVPASPQPSGLVNLGVLRCQ